MTEPFCPDKLDAVCPLCGGYGLVSAAAMESRREGERSTRMLSGVLLGHYLLSCLLLLVVTAVGVIIGVALP